MFEKNEFFKEIFDFQRVYLNQTKMQTFLEISVNFRNDWKWDGYVTVYT